MLATRMKGTILILADTTPDTEKTSGHKTDGGKIHTNSKPVLLVARWDIFEHFVGKIPTIEDRRNMNYIDTNS